MMLLEKKILKEYLSIWLNVDEDLIISRIKRNAKKIDLTIDAGISSVEIIQY